MTVPETLFDVDVRALLSYRNVLDDKPRRQRGCVTR
jgi:hypothetical protein